MAEKRDISKSLAITRKILRYVWRFLPLAFLFIILNIVYTLSYQARVVLLKPLFDKGFANLTTNIGLTWITIKELALIALILAIALAIIRYFKEYIMGMLMLKIIVAIRNDICAQILKQALSFFNKRRAGDFFSRITNDVVVSQRAINFLLGDIIEQPFMILGAYAVAFYINWQLALGTIVLFPLFAIPVIKLGKKVKRSQKKSLVKLGDVTEVFYQLITGIRVVKSYGMEDAEQVEFEKQNNSFFRRTLKVVRAKATNDGIMEFMQTGSLAAILFAGGYLVVNGLLDMTIGDFAAFVGAMVSLNRPVRVFAKAYNSLQESLAGCERIFEVIDAEPEITDPENAGDITKIDSISIENLNFTYGNEPVLKDINISASRGDIIAVVGPSGAGKSTLLDLLTKFYVPNSGKITVDGVDIKSISTDSYLSCVALVGQDPFLFNTTIKGNILYGREGATDEEIREAAKKANIHDFIMELPGGYDSIAGDRGVLLSGGQRQRISIARAVLRNPHLLLLDEATSALDSESEQLVQEALTELMYGRTTFVIAHRLSTVKHAKRIIVLEEGRIVESGTHEELLRSGGLYEKLYTYQFSMDGPER